MANNREISQFAGLVTVADSTNNVSLGNTFLLSGNARLGVGTDNPAVKTHISDSTSSVGVTGTEILRVANTRLNTGTGAVAIRLVNNEIAGENQYTRAQIAAELDTPGTNDNTGRLMFATANSSGTLVERIRISNTGNVGIGTTNPNTTLHVNGRIQTTDFTSTSNGNALVNSFTGCFQTGLRVLHVTTPKLDLWHDGNSVGQFRFSSGVLTYGTHNGNDSITPRLTIDNSGRIQHNTTYNDEWGAGFISHKPQSVTTTYFRPSGQYTASLGKVDNTNTTQFISIDSSYAQSSAVAAGIFLSAFHQDAGGSNCGFTLKNLRTEAGGLVFSSVTTAGSVGSPAGETERLRITSTGNVGIGTNNPGTKLDVRISTTAFVNGTVLNSYPISKYINSSSDGADRGLEIGAPTGSVSSPVYLKVSGTGNRFAILNQSDSEQLTILTSGNVGIGTTNPGFKLEVNGSFAATTKSFLIEHPTKKNYKLRHGSLEGPENGVYVRGRTSTNIIELPEYWTGLVDADSITVNLTPIGNCHIWVEEINNNKVYINSEDTIDCFYTILAERKDVEKLIVEIEEN